MFVTGARSTAELDLYRSDSQLRWRVDAIHNAQCGCENWVACCLIRPGFLEQTVRELLGKR